MIGFNWHIRKAKKGRANLFFDFFSTFIVVPLSPVKWGRRRIALYLRVEVDEFGNVIFSVD